MEKADDEGRDILPTRAKDMFGLTGEIVRSYVDNGAIEALRYDYGINEDEALLSLHCADLASLPAWDAETLLEAATVYSSHNKVMAERHGYLVEGDDAAQIDRTKRRIRLALLAEKSADVMSPADGVLLLQRAGIRVFHELLDAVAMAALDGPNPDVYWQLKGLPASESSTSEPQKEGSRTGTQLKPTDVPDGWSLKMPVRFVGYRAALYKVLKKARGEGRATAPRARDVLEYLDQDPHPDVQVMSDGLKYGNNKTADLRAIQKAINGLVTVTPPRE
jgi:hypothetical protein